MLFIRDMILEDQEEVLKMVSDFYHSDAVDHVVEDELLTRTFLDAVGEEPAIRGVMLYKEERVVGFAYLTVGYACEVGGKVLIIEEIFMKEECRGKGYGKAFFIWLFETYTDIVRFRLEVTDNNEGASGLYKKLGFRYLSYDQMILDR